MKRFFTSDFHLGSSLLLNKDVMKDDVRNFKSVEKMNAAFIRSCQQRASEEDVIIHCGDFASYGMDRGNKGLDVNPRRFLEIIPAQVILIKGNHDLSNKCKPVADSMRISLGKIFKDVSISHYPSYNIHAKDQFLDYDIHLCGHVHRQFKHCLDLDHNVLNINVGVDVWNYRIVSEEELISYISKLLKKTPDELYKCKTDKNGKLRFFGKKDI